MLGGGFSVAGDAVLDPWRLGLAPGPRGQSLFRADRERRGRRGRLPYGLRAPRLRCGPRVLLLFARERDAAALRAGPRAGRPLRGRAEARRISSPCGGRAARAG
ncbi:hypothetical protein STTU_2782 [Streptomyces sp. Tu6071]|nr:hypothetical protein STTU_2782 [Streptomyces sp. Tu6071]